MRIIPLCLAIAMSVTSGAAAAREHKVLMLNSSPQGPMVFEPQLVRVAPGDTVRFVATTKGHNVESLPALSPAGAAPFKSALNQEVVVTFRTPGLYVYKCTPHFSMGMVGVVQVGAPVNRPLVTAGIAKLPPLARKRAASALAAVR